MQTANRALRASIFLGSEVTAARLTASSVRDKQDTEEHMRSVSFTWSEWVGATCQPVYPVHPAVPGSTGDTSFHGCGRRVGTTGRGAEARPCDMSSCVTAARDQCCSSAPTAQCYNSQEDALLLHFQVVKLTPCLELMSDIHICGLSSGTFKVAASTDTPGISSKTRQDLHALSGHRGHGWHVIAASVL